jgi:hypothetical protein
MVTNYRVVFLPDNIEIEVPEGKKRFTGGRTGGS